MDELGIMQELTLLNIKQVLHKKFPMCESDKLGVNLGIPWSDIKTFKHDCGSDSERLFNDIISHWLNNDKDQSWSKLADALKLSHYGMLAESIKARAKNPSIQSSTIGLKHPQKKSSSTNDCKIDLLHGLFRHQDIKAESEIHTQEEFLRFILQKSVRAKLCFTVIIGFPYSGTSTLLHKILGCSEEDYPSSRGLDIWSTALFKDFIKDEGHFAILNKNYNDEHDAMLFYSLSKLFLTNHFELSAELFNSRLPEFSTKLVQSHFSSITSKLTKFMLSMHSDSTNEHSKQVALLKLQGFINFCDVNVNKAVNEFAYLVTQKCNSGLLIFVLDIMFYTVDRLSKSFDADDPYYEGQYREQEVQFLKSFIMIEYFMETLKAIFSGQEAKADNKILIVGTHKKEIESDASFDDEIVKLRQYFDDITGKMKIGHVKITKVTNATTIECIREVLKDLLSKIHENFRENQHIELKFMFFYSVLQSTGRLFLTKEEVATYATDCRLDSQEMKEFLDLFQDCLFLLNFDKYVILQIQDFFQGLEKIYYTDGRIQDKFTRNIKYGIYPHSLCDQIWKDDNKNKNVADFYISTLESIGLAIQLTPAMSEKPASYFMPSLRNDYFDETANENVVKAGSLIIRYHKVQLPLHMQCNFVQGFKSISEMNSFEILNSSYVNVTNFQSIINGEIVEATLSFFRHYTELSADIKIRPTSQTEPNQTKKRCIILATLKSKCIYVLHKIRENYIPTLRYSFSVICPRSDPGRPHVIEFTHATIKANFTCQECKDKEYSDDEWKDKRFLWVKAVHEGSTTHPEDILNVSGLQEVVHIIYKESLNGSGIKPISLAEKLEIQYDDLDARPKVTNSSENILFHILYQWITSLKPSQSKNISRKDLARTLQKCEYDQIAYALDPMLLLGHYLIPDC